MSEPFTGGIRDPLEWKREQEQRTSALLAKAEEAKLRLAENIVSQTSADHVVTLSVNPGGGLTGLTLTQDADRMPHTQLASLILSTYNQAARKAAEQTMEIMSTLVGPDSGALDILRESMPMPVDEQGHAPDARRARRTRDSDPDEGYEGDAPLFGRGDR